MLFRSFSFDTPNGGVFLRCFENECLTLEGGNRALLLQINKEMNWPPVPEQPKVLEKTAKEIAERSRSYGSNDSRLKNWRVNGFAGAVMQPAEGQVD